jgi:XFP C-terminal domain
MRRTMPLTTTSTSAAAKEEGAITTPFDKTVLNDLDRFHVVMDEDPPEIRSWKWRIAEPSSRPAS